MAEASAPIDEVGERVRAGRAPLAAAAVLVVLAGGAAFLTYAMTAPTRPSPVAAAPAVERPDPPPPAAVAPPLPEPSVRAPSPAAANPAAATPRLKPQPAATVVRREPSRSVLSLATPWTAEESERPPPFFHPGDLARARPMRRDGDGDILGAPRQARVSLEKGETFVDALRRIGVRAEDRHAAAAAIADVYNMRRMRVGQELVLTLADPNQTLFQLVSASAPAPAYLIALDFRIDPENRVALKRDAAGGFSTTQLTSPLTTRIASIEGVINGSLYVSAKRQGAPDKVIAELAQMFAYDVDFQREILGGDEFEALFEVRFDDSGGLVGGGDILYGRLNWRGRQKEKGYYRFDSGPGGRADYFDATGESARRLLMKTPIDGARLSSGFGLRRHPILGYQKEHKGVDFAASRGTPIMAAGDGVVERAGPYGSFGNYVRIRHAQGYKTAYAHMSAIKKGVRTGVRVRQGDVIGYVGATGRSTGPHLHYEVHLRDRPVNPQTLKIATGYALSGSELARFKMVRDRIDAMRGPPAAPQAELVAEQAPPAKSAL